MNEILLHLTSFPIPVILSAIFATIATNAIKILIKGRLSATSEKELSEKISDLCFFSCLILSIPAYLLTVFFSGISFTFVGMITFSVCSLSASELIYSLYEKVGIKKAVKALLELLSGKSTKDES